jgi:ryanodine receptor 2
MLALHIPEEDRCIDILELIEMEKLLRFESHAIKFKFYEFSRTSKGYYVCLVILFSFHYHTLTLYAALCYQSNFKAAHSLCSYVDQKQLLYAIQEEYMSGPLRRGFYDLLIALHLESFATTM